MKYILITMFLTMFMYGQGINTRGNYQNDWCIDSREVEEWTLIDKKGKLYIFTAEELSSLPKDEYNFISIGEKNNLNLGWVIDFRKLVFGKEQDYEINGTKATYTQDNDLTEEVIFSANAEFIKKISNSEKLSFALDGFLSTQETSGLQASVYYIMKL